MKLSQNTLVKNILTLLMFGLGAVFLWYVINTMWSVAFIKSAKQQDISKNTKESRTLTVTATPIISIKPTANSLSETCNDELWKHIYHSYRLKIINKCIQVIGTVEVIRIEKDGDDHILLKLDAGQENLINQKNVSQQKGDLVLEPVCIHNVTQEDAISACEGFHSYVVVPPVGTHVKVVGSFVLDTSHGWNEIHPVSQIVVTQ